MGRPGRLERRTTMKNTYNTQHTEPERRRKRSVVLCFDYTTLREMMRDINRTDVPYESGRHLSYGEAKSPHVPVIR